MRIYIRNYMYRISGLIATITTSLALMFFLGLLFGYKVNHISDQIETYNNSGYSIAYILNYKSSLSNEYVYADKDILLYVDHDTKKRVAASCLMYDIDTEYNIKCNLELNEKEAIISKNIAEYYGLEIGDNLLASFPYSEDTYEIVIKEIYDTEYDFGNPSIENNVGVIYIGYDKEYVENTLCKYIVFSEKSEAEYLSDKMQIINKIINKDNQIYDVLSQGAYIWGFEILFSIALCIVVQSMFFSKSKKYLRKCILKGMKQQFYSFVPFIERFCFVLIPVSISLFCCHYYISCNSIYTLIFYLIPEIIVCTYCFIMLILKK